MVQSSVRRPQLKTRVGGSENEGRREEESRADPPCAREKGKGSSSK